MLALIWILIQTTKFKKASKSPLVIPKMKQLLGDIRR